MILQDCNTRRPAHSSSNQHWSSTLKVRLPINPKSDSLRVILYDSLQPKNSNTNNNKHDLQIQHPQQTKELSVPLNTSTNEVAKREPDEALYSGDYIYLGEVKVSLTQLFRHSEISGPQWYSLYDKKRRNPRFNQLVGQLKLSFALGCNFKRISPTVMFKAWNARYSANLANNKSLQKAIGSKSDSMFELGSGGDRSTSGASSQSLDPVVVEDVGSLFNNYDENEHLSMDENEPYETDDDYENEKAEDVDDEEDIDYDEDDEGEEDMALEPEVVDILNRTLHNLKLSHDANANILQDLDLMYEVMSLDEDDCNRLAREEIEMMAHSDNQNGYSEFPPVVTALDEYDVVGLKDDKNSPNPSSLGIETSSKYLDVWGGSDFASNGSSFEDLSEGDSRENEYLDYDIIEHKLMKHRGKRFNNRLKTPFKRPPTSKSFYLGQENHSMGVMFIHFDRIDSLPSLRKKVSGASYVMDPFVIATFGRKVFKTTWRKHTLNPVFNEYTAFEIFPEELNMGIHFKVMDKDSFSYNDKIAKGSLDWSDIIYNKANINKETDILHWRTYELPLTLSVIPQKNQTKKPTLRLKIKFLPYRDLFENFWIRIISSYSLSKTLDFAQLLIFLNKFGSFSEDDAMEFFSHFDKQAWRGDQIDTLQMAESLRTWNKTKYLQRPWKCPYCHRSGHLFVRHNKHKRISVTENDIVTHFVICEFNHKNKNVLRPLHVSAEFASKRWFTRFLIKLTYGKYSLGSNNANILVQDRETGIIIEEKISAHVKVGMRIIYNGKGKESKNFKYLLKTLSIRQGKKFDSVTSAKMIDSFIKFHSLDMSQCESREFKTFNEFFYRKLKPGSRLIEGESPNVMVSPADSRCTVFSTIRHSKEIWIKGSNFTLTRLTGDYKPGVFNEENSSIGIFRLAPQDYHRFHSPINGKIGKPIDISGEYYTVNPIAVRSELDVFGENVRVVIPIESPEFGPILVIPVGAMMVGSIVLTKQEGDIVERGEELGYFKFGGSTIILVAPSKKVIFDADLLRNSAEGIETLVKVGMSIGHSPNVNESIRSRIQIKSPEQLETIKRKITVHAENSSSDTGIPWEFHTWKEMMQD